MESFPGHSGVHLCSQHSGDRSRRITGGRACLQNQPSKANSMVGSSSIFQVAFYRERCLRSVASLLETRDTALDYSMPLNLLDIETHQLISTLLKPVYTAKYFLSSQLSQNKYVSLGELRSMILFDVPKSKGWGHELQKAFTEKKITDVTKNPRPKAIAQW